MSDFLPFIVIGLTSGSVYGLAGAGLVVTYKTSGIFNFAHGTIAALVAFAFYDLRQKHHMQWPIAFVLCVLVLSPLLGLLLEQVARRVSGAPVTMRIVATVGLLVALQQVIIIRYGAATLTTDQFLPTHTYRLVGVNVSQDQLIVMAIGLVGVAALTVVLSWTPLGRSMRAVVDNPELVALTGTSPVKVRRIAWCIGTAFAGLSGVLLAPSVGLDGTVLTLLVVQAFGAAAIGMFRSLPLTYVGGLVVGVLSSLSTKYVGNHPTLSGLPPSLPFIVLFLVLVVAPRGWLTDFFGEGTRAIVTPRRLPPPLVWTAGAVLALLLLFVPEIVGTKLPVYTSALAYAIIFLSLALLVRTSGQVSLAQLAFAAVGGAASARLAADAGWPWFLAVVVGSLIAVPVGAILAIPAIRRSGVYLALATFGFGVLLERLVFSTSLMFGSATSIPAPRPSIARGDHAYFYLSLAFLALAVAFVAVLQRSRLGRLLRAMADSPTAVSTYGTSVTVIKIIVFCVAAFLAALGGALLGPVTDTASPVSFAALASLTLLAVLTIIPGSDIVAALGAAAAFIVVPSYLSGTWFNDYLPILFGGSALLVAMDLPHALGSVPLRNVGGWARRDRPPAIVDLHRDGVA